MSKRRKGLPEGEDSVEKEVLPLSERTWRRRRWRKPRGQSVARCVVCGAGLNRRDTYYLRPAYTDGEVWLCSGCYDRLSSEAHIVPDHRYGRRGHEQ